MYGLKNSEVLAHHIMTMAGGFFGVYALLNRSLTFGSSETSNLIYLFVAGLTGDGKEFLIRIIAFSIYVGGMMFATIMSRIAKDGDIRYLSAVIDIICCVILAQIPQEIHEVIALYPMFFTTAVQWLAYTNAGGFSSATIFSTNNCRQCFSALANYLYDHDKKHLPAAVLFGGSLIFFHIGVIYSWCCMQVWGLSSIYACIPIAAAGIIAVRYDRKRKERTGTSVYIKKTA